MNPNDWAQQGMLDAKQYAYSVAQEQELTPDYIKNAQDFSQKKAALAGYRLGNLLNQLFSP